MVGDDASPGWVTTSGLGWAPPADRILGELASGVVLIDAEGAIQGFNLLAERLLGLDRSSLGARWDRRVELVDDRLARLSGERMLQSCPLVGVRPLSTPHPFQWIRLDVNHVATGEVAFTEILLAPAAELRRELDERARDQEHFSILARHAADSVLRVDRQGRFLFINRTVVQPRPPEELIGLSFRELGLDPKLVALWGESMEQAAADLRPVAIEFQLPGVGRPRSMAGQVIPEVDRAGNVTSFLVTNWDVTARRADEAALRFAKFTLDHAGVPILWADQAGWLVYANHAAIEQLGYDADEVLKLHLFDISPTLSRERWAALWERLKRGEHIQLESTYRHRDGHVFPVEADVKGMEHGDQFFACAFVRNISERKEEEARRATMLETEHEARQRAEEASRAKELFLAIASHELRSPLTALLLRTQKLRKGGACPPGIDDELARIEASVRTQRRLIEDLLDVSAINTGKLTLDREPLDLMTPLCAALDEVRPRAQRKSVELVLAPTEKRGPVTGDAIRLQQVFVNLLGNAIKFSLPRGKVRVRLWEEAGRGDPGRVRVEVSDQGKGIAPDFLPQIFGFFSQEETGSRRSHGGLGVGLAISRALISQHGGTLRAESAGEGKGAKFIVELPIRQDRVHEAPAHH
jgi:PAS domain S-box-containing protein